ncbi:hypothetical protein KPG66_15095 [Mycetohabitans sp. B2]|uniref:hypothetical protein n=1 Tax=Mycetohabitans sp. B2 TaxID=2841274 RepID=UPI001F21673C|nr:hypothetical protein [Mycetohabitans sp. B2]MCF7697322.1 hypothetical protein [Mycetohabitans sp. B2]
MMKRHVVHLLFTTLMVMLAAGIEGCRRADNSEVAPSGSSSTVAPASGASQ